jgi:hypothetical protein
MEELDAAFVVKDANGQKLRYVYFDDPRSADKAAHARRSEADRREHC